MLTVAFGSVLKAEGEGELGFVFKELICKRVPPGHKDHLHVDHLDADDGDVVDADGDDDDKNKPKVVAVVRPLLQPLVHLKDLVVRLQKILVYDLQ